MPRLIRPVLLRLMLALVLLLPLAAGRAMAASEAEVRAALTEMLTGPDRLALPIERIRAALKSYYVDNRGPLYWSDTARMDKLIARLEQAEYDGLNPADYPAGQLAELRDTMDFADAYRAAEAELYFDAFLVAYGADLKIGRVAPQKVDPHLFRSRKTIDVLRLLSGLGKQPDPAAYLTAMEPKNPHYQALKKILRAYIRLAQSGSNPAIAAGATVKPGGSDPRMAQIRALLALTGDYAGPPSASATYDAALAKAVINFQARHGLEAKGLIGKQTILALNVPPAERKRQITLNMERWRWLPDDLGAEHLLVNIAGYELNFVQQGQVSDNMNVVVGAVATQTPEFSDQMEYVDLNPTWTVPYTIATKEMLPRLKANPYAYAAEYDIFVNGKLASWAGITWANYGTGAFPFTFRQKPGPTNALGRVKFMFPNKHNIYHHDTPARDKFAFTTRAFSHGCIRLSRPIDLAYDLIARLPGWSRERIDAVLASGITTRVSLPTPIPVHLVYATAFKGARGVEFRPDIYGRDRKLSLALFGRVPG